jgi:hypothetical protein
MASHREIKVGDTDWVIRIAGEDVQVKILEKLKKSSGRGYEFRCKRFSNGRSVGRNLTRGSGSFRRPGQQPKATGFAGNKPAPPKRAAKPAAKRAAAKPRVRSYTAPTTSYSRNPPPSAFFPKVQEPGAPSRRSASSSANGRPGKGKLGSLRGRGSSSATRAPAQAADSPSPTKARREIEKLLKQAGTSDLVKDLVKRLINSDGTEHAAQRIYGEVMSQHRMRSYGMGFRR